MFCDVQGRCMGDKSREEEIKELLEGYEYLSKYTVPVKEAEREIVGRDEEMRSILAAFHRPELSNVILLGEAGSGKTALVQGVMKKDSDRVYLEVNLSRMISDLHSENEMADYLKRLFEETSEASSKEGRELVLFIDEFHQIVQLSTAAVEVLKPLLADSGTRGIRVIAATTYVEFREYISSNQPLVERLMRINLRQPDRDMTIAILRGMAKRYGADLQFHDDFVFGLIYDYTERYIPANSQPRKSILVLDAMVGWHRFDGRRMDEKLLADVLYDMENVNVAFRVDATKIKERLDEKVFAQGFATTAIANRLQICVADLNDPTRPMSSMLFCGSSGVGKTEVTKQLAQILFNDRRNLHIFDMTEFANPDSLERFRDALTTAVWERPYSIVLLDEIEKACAPVTRLLLQVLDDGRLSDRNNREVSFINTYFVLTTNAGSEIFKTIAQYNPDDDGSGEQFNEIMTAVKRSITAIGEARFPPELLGRIDTIVPFQPLSEKTMERIAKSKLEILKHEVWDKHHAKLSVDGRVINYLVYDNLSTDSDAGGARQIVSKIEEDIVAPLARFLNEHPGEQGVGVIVVGELASENKNKRKSDAHIQIGRMK